MAEKIGQNTRLKRPERGCASLLTHRRTEGSWSCPSTNACNSRRTWQDGSEKNVFRRSGIRAKHTSNREGRIPFVKLVRGEELAPEGLPHVNLNLRRDASFPKRVEPSCTKSANQCTMEGFN